MESPTLTVLVPTCDRPALLRCALASIQRQSFEDFETIVLNDGGPSVEAVVGSLRDDRIVLADFPTNRGKAAILNDGLQQARGRYIAYLDDDDEYLADHLQTLFEALQTHREYRWAYADTLIRYHREDSPSREAVFTEIENEASVNFPMLYWENYINHKNALHEKNLALEVGGYDPAGRFYIDWEIFLRMAAVATPLHVRHVTSVYYRPMFATGNKTFQSHADPAMTEMRVDQLRRNCMPDSESGPLVSLILAFGQNPPAIEATVDAALANSHLRTLEFVLPDTGGLDFLKQRLDAGGIRWQVAGSDGRSESRAANEMAAKAKGDILGFLRPGAIPLPGWIQAGIRELVRGVCGIAGSLDLDSTGIRVCHAGVRLSQDGTPSFPGEGMLSTHPIFRQNCSFKATAANTMFIRRGVFEQAGGFDTTLPDVAARVDLSLKVAATGRENLCVTRSVTCQSRFGPTVPSALLPSLHQYSAAWRRRSSDKSMDLPGQDSQPAEVPNASGCIDLQDGSASRSYRIEDPGTLSRALTKAAKVLLIGTARPPQVHRVIDFMTRPGKDLTVDLLVNANTRAAYEGCSLLRRRFEFDFHRIHLSLLPWSLVDALSRERYALAVVVMNSMSLRDYGHVFALARIIGASSQYAIAPPFLAIRLARGGLRIHGAWSGESPLEQHVARRRSRD